jgi:PKD repeat protein
VARVTDPDTHPAALTATIDWGDGTVSTGTVTDTNAVTESVTGQHVYRRPGWYSVTVTVSDPGAVMVRRTTSQVEVR